MQRDGVIIHYINGTLLLLIVDFWRKWFLWKVDDNIKSTQPANFVVSDLLRGTLDADSPCFTVEPNKLSAFVNDNIFLQDFPLKPWHPLLVTNITFYHYQHTSFYLYFYFLWFCLKNNCILLSCTCVNMTIKNFKKCYNFENKCVHFLNRFSVLCHGQCK